MSGHAFPHRGVKAVIGAVVLAAVVFAAALKIVPRAKIPLTREALEGRVGSLPGFGGVLSLTLDGFEYNGQEAARTLAVDVLVLPAAPSETLAGSMKAAGDFLRERVSVYHKLVVTGYRRRIDFQEGLAFAARALWLAPELAAPMDGWSVLRLPDSPREAARALEGIYANPSVTAVADGALVATVDLETELRARPAADLNEILSAPLVACFDYDSAFERSPALESLDVTVLSGGRKAARFRMTREAYEAADVSRLVAELSKTVLKISTKEFAIAENYSSGELYTPLLFEKVVKQEDREEIAALESARREAEMSFYKALFARGLWENVDTGPTETDSAHGEASE